MITGNTPTAVLVRRLANHVQAHRNSVSRGQFRLDLKKAGKALRCVREAILGAYSRGLTAYFNSKNVKAN